MGCLAMRECLRRQQNTAKGVDQEFSSQNPLQIIKYNKKFFLLTTFLKNNFSHTVHKELGGKFFLLGMGL